MEGATVFFQQSRFLPLESGIDVQGVNISVPGRDLLQDAHLQLRPGVHYGLLGRNGVGKSLLLGALASGQLLSPFLRERVRVMLIRQTLEADVEEAAAACITRTVLEELQRKPTGMLHDGSDHEGPVLTEAERWNALADQQSGLRGKIARQKALDIRHEQAAAAAPVPEEEAVEGDVAACALVPMPAVLSAARSMGLPHSMLSAPLATLSGGWKMRVQLAKALLYQPDLLLLDEPTNHLDVAGVSWLQGAMQQELEGMTILMVSHERSFLNACAHEVLLLRNRRLESFVGNYDSMLQQLQDKAAYTERMHEALERKRGAMQASIEANVRLARKQGDDKRLRQAASRRTKLEERTGFERSAKGHRFKLNRDRIGYFLSARGEVERVQGEGAAPPLRMALPAPDLRRLQGPLLVAQDVGFERPGGFRLQGISLSVEAGERVVILGANGQGKSTLLGLLAGEVAPACGEVRRPGAVGATGYFRQAAVAALGSETATAAARLATLFPSAREDELRGQLGAFGLGAAAAATGTALGRLSGGQRVAYALAELSWPRPCLLLLDEADNHLDVEALEALEEALREYEGAVVMVTHDLTLAHAVATRVLWLRGGTLQPVELDRVDQEAQRDARDARRQG